MSERPSTSSSYASAQSSFSVANLVSAFAHKLGVAQKPGPLDRLSSASNNGVSNYNAAREPIECYLRLKPASAKDIGRPAPIELLNDTLLTVQPNEDRNRLALNANPLPHLFRFTKIFSFNTTQSDLFTAVALPKVQDVLNGNSAMLFAYGVSCSGKTYSVQGTEAAPGLLPRSLDVIFNSIAGKHSTCQFRPSGILGVEVMPKSEAGLYSVASLGLKKTHNQQRFEADPTVLQISSDHQYSVFVSYAEIYNERIYDLLESSSFGSSNSVSTIRPDTVSQANARRKVLGLKRDKTSDQKYIGGLREVRVFTADEAKQVLRHGQNNRQVFSTLLNQQSSRSHGIFTIRLVRNQQYCKPDDVTSTSCSRFCVVDLAGSERTSYSGATGERLKEAGNINKSLMVLSNCMEVLRRNQNNLAKGKKPAVVPFRHSKLTEVLESYLGEFGRAAMIVNLSPWHLPLEENLNVLRFSAVAKEITTSKSSLVPPTRRFDLIEPFDPSFTLSSCDITLEDVLEEEEEEEEEEDDGAEEDDELVNYLFTYNEELQTKTEELEMQLEMLPIQLTNKLHREYEDQIRAMEDDADRRVDEAIRRNDAKWERKLALLQPTHDTAAIRTPKISPFEVEVSMSPLKQISNRTVLGYTPGKQNLGISKLTSNRRMTRSTASEDDSLFDPMAEREVKAKAAPPKKKQTKAVFSDDDDASVILEPETIKKKRVLKPTLPTEMQELDDFEEGDSFIKPAKLSKSRSTISLKTSTSMQSVRLRP